MKKRFITLGLVCLLMTGCQAAHETIPETTTIALLLPAVLLEMFCPRMDALRAVLITLLTLAAIYAIWFGWYVLSNKRTYIEDKDSENGELRVEEENAWKMVSRVHSIVLVLVMVLGGLYLYSEIW